MNPSTPPEVSHGPALATAISHYGQPYQVDYMEQCLGAMQAADNASTALATLQTLLAKWSQARPLLGLVCMPADTAGWGLAGHAADAAGHMDPGMLSLGLCHDRDSWAVSFHRRVQLGLLANGRHMFIDIKSSADPAEHRAWQATLCPVYVGLLGSRSVGSHVWPWVQCLLHVPSISPPHFHLRPGHRISGRSSHQAESKVEPETTA